MNIDAATLGQFIAISVPIIGILSFYLGKRKTTMPVKVTIIGVILACLPPIGLLYAAMLSLKSDNESSLERDSTEQKTKQAGL